MKLEKVLYTHASATGGRDGRAESSDGQLNVKLAVPKENGGGNGMNPEQLFAAGYSACFWAQSALWQGNKKCDLA
jgi:Ohr subfamily peroxiredoxin